MYAVNLLAKESKYLTDFTEINILKDWLKKKKLLFYLKIISFVKNLTLNVYQKNLLTYDFLVVQCRYIVTYTLSHKNLHQRDIFNIFKV